MTFRDVFTKMLGALAFLLISTSVYIHYAIPENAVKPFNSIPLTGRINVFVLSPAFSKSDHHDNAAAKELLELQLSNNKNWDAPDGVTNKLSVPARDLSALRELWFCEDTLTTPDGYRFVFSQEDEIFAAFGTSLGKSGSWFRGYTPIQTEDSGPLELCSPFNSFVFSKVVKTLLDNADLEKISEP